jgi:uncharacterized membrane protein
MTNSSKTLMTAALGGLMLAATVSAASAQDKRGDAVPNPQTTGECHGVNSCKGTSACHGAGNTCAGKNECKGKGWIKATKADCDKKGGTFKVG